MSYKTNAAEGEALTSADVELFEAAREAIMAFKRSLDNWVKIGHAVVRVREIPTGAAAARPSCD